jgi:serine/threonine protein kinase
MNKTELSFLSGLLELDPGQRLSAAGALQHPYLRDLWDADTAAAAAEVGGRSVSALSASLQQQRKGNLRPDGAGCSADLLADGMHTADDDPGNNVQDQEVEGEDELLHCDLSSIATRTNILEQVISCGAVGLMTSLICAVACSLQMVMILHHMRHYIHHCRG